MDRALHEQTIDFFFKPTETLLSQYSRYVVPEEVISLRKRFESLKFDLESAFTNGDMYEAYVVRQELKEACQDLRERINIYKREYAPKV